MEEAIAMAKGFLGNSWFTLRADKMLINGGLDNRYGRVSPGSGKMVRSRADMEERLRGAKNSSAGLFVDGF